jgi:hypothetical protein
MFCKKVLSGEKFFSSLRASSALLVIPLPLIFTTGHHVHFQSPVPHGLSSEGSAVKRFEEQPDHDLPILTGGVCPSGLISASVCPVFRPDDTVSQKTDTIVFGFAQNDLLLP